MYIGGGVLNDLHRHYTASLIFALQGEYRVSAESSPEWQTYRGSLVAPNVQQQMDARDCRIVILQIDPETASYDGVLPWFESGLIQRLPEELVGELARAAHAALGAERFDALELWNTIIALVARPGVVRPGRDARIAQALTILKRDVLSPPAAADLAHSVGLSEGRLIHLFTQEMGLPIRRYVLWLRLRAVVFALAEGASMTEAAHAAGFADSAHMSRTFREMFGLPPSLFLKTSSTIKLEFVLPPESELPEDPTERERWTRLRAKLGAS
jgi:AraC-like DNA-binding protein